MRAEFSAAVPESGKLTGVLEVKRNLTFRWSD
jgi:hypothetical protein